MPCSRKNVSVSTAVAPVGVVEGAGPFVVFVVHAEVVTIRAAPSAASAFFTVLLQLLQLETPRLGITINHPAQQDPI